MKIDTSRVTLVIIAGVLATGVIARPEWLGDSNTFLRNFVNHEYLNVLGVILAITLASLAQAHLALNRMEEQRGYEFLTETRREVRNAAYWLIGLFALGFGVTLTKPLICQSETATAFSNSLAIFILAFYVLILIDITMAVFDLKADIKNDQSPKGGQDKHN